MVIFLNKMFLNVIFELINTIISVILEIIIAITV